MNKFVKKPNILIPNTDIDYQKWAVVACDQFTSQPDYWEKLKEYVGDEPSTLNLIFPEVYLNTNRNMRTALINETMKDYYDKGIFKQIDDFILVRRICSDGKTRLGLMVEIDLEAYDYTPENTAPIKATERTVVERLPVRISVRRNASLEVPHIMLLVDDAEKAIIEPLYTDSDNYERLYDFELNMGGGRLTGYRVTDSEALEERLNALFSDPKGMVFAVGDGNHSLATAKECWNEIKKSLSEEEIETHPARYALCELVNLHDESLVFEPIHRIVLNADEDFIVEMARVLDGDARLKLIYSGKKYVINVPENPSDAIKDIQNFIDEYIAEHPLIEIDYIHGDDHLKSVAQNGGGVAIFMPTIDKSGLFDYVTRRGVLPRKSFSMGAAEDKRYYFEAHKITK